MDQINIMDIFAYYFSEYDTNAFNALGFSTQTSGFESIASLYGKKSSYLRRLRDEYDVVTSSTRRGQCNRPPRERIIRFNNYLCDYSFEEITEIVKAFIDNKTNNLKFQEEQVSQKEYANLPLMSETDLENLLNFQDTSACIRVKSGNKKVRVYNTSIIKQLKKLYNGQCQLCNGKVFNEFDADICEAHHIDAFSESQNNDVSNIIILCPNHHRLLHKLNPVYNHSEKIFDFGQGKTMHVELDYHLDKQV